MEAEEYIDLSEYLETWEVPKETHEEQFKRLGLWGNIPSSALIDTIVCRWCSSTYGKSDPGIARGLSCGGYMCYQAMSDWLEQLTDWGDEEVKEWYFRKVVQGYRDD